MYHLNTACIGEVNQKLFFTLLLFDTSWSRTGPRYCSCQSCQGNIRGSVFWPWPTKHFLASFNFIMKAWTATNSQIGTKPIWGPHPPLPLSTRPIPICHWPIPLNRKSVCMKTNVCHPLNPLHSLGRGGEAGCVKTRTVFMCVPPRSCPSPPLSATPTHHRSHPPLYQVHSTMMLFLLYEGACFQTHMGCSTESGTMWLCNHENHKVYSTSAGRVRIVLGFWVLACWDIHSDAVAMGYV